MSQGLLKKHYRDRPKWPELLRHPFIRDFEPPLNAKTGGFIQKEVNNRETADLSAKTGKGAAEFASSFITYPQSMPRHAESQRVLRLQAASSQAKLMLVVPALYTNTDLKESAFQ